MDPGPLLISQIDAGAKFIQEFAKTIPLRAAFWLKETDDWQWHLYVASDHVDDQAFPDSYGEVLRITRNEADRWLDPFQITVIRASERLVQDVLEVQRENPPGVPIRHYSRRLGARNVKEAYIYPLPIAVPS